MHRSFCPTTGRRYEQRLVELACWTVRHCWFELFVLATAVFCGLAVACQLTNQSDRLNGKKRIERLFSLRFPVKSFLWNYLILLVTF